MLNILHTIETHGPGGAESVLLNLASSFNGEEYRAYGFFIKNGWIVKQFKKNGFGVEVYKNKYKIDIPLLLRLIGFIRKNKITLIHAHEFSMGFYSTLASLITKVPCILTIHGKNEIGLKTNVKKVAYRFVMKNSTTVSVSENLKNWISESYVINKNIIKTIHNGINLQDLILKGGKRQENRKMLINDLKISENAVIVASVGRLYPIKGQEYLIRAASLAIKKFSNAHFLIVGDGPDSEKLNHLVHEHDLTQNIHFLGESKIVPQLLSASDIFTLSSLSEGLSISILEAMAFGLPIVATDVGDNSKLVVDKENGFIVSTGDTEALSRQIVDLLKNPKKRMAFGSNSKNRVKSEFNNQKMLSQYKEIYNFALNKYK